MKKKKRYNGFFKLCAYVMTMAFMLPAWIATRDLIMDGVRSGLAMFILAIASWGFVVSGGVFIIIGAGEKDASGKIHLAHADNLFTEFWIFATAAFIGGLYSLNDLVIENMDSQSMAYQVLTMLIVETGTLIFLIFMAGIVRRLKGGVFYKNSLTGLISKEIVKTAWYRNLNAVWRVTILFVIYSAAAIGLMFLGRSNPLLAAGGILLLSMIYIVLFSSLSIELDRIKKGAQELASGNMEYKLTGHRMSLTREIAENLNRIGDGLQEAVSVQTRSERLKSELITNVSHDIKTPLTSIINYVDLLKKESVGNETAQSYLDILDKKSLRLKDLTEDLIEASKASTGNLNVAYTRLNGKELVNQAVGEYKERFEQRGLDVIVNLPQEDLTLWADGRHTFRILENMLSNACKYSLEKSRVYVDLLEENGMGYIIVKNISDRPLNITEEELMQRFVRGDSSRSTQGSGLGLSIALSLAELQGGEFQIRIDGDLFKAVASFQLPETQQI